MLRAYSYGGGVQSQAVLVLTVQGRLQYDAFLFANVGEDSENPDTLDYVHNIAMPYAAQHGLDLIELRKTRRSGETETLWNYIHRTARSVPIPARMANGAPGNRSCTQEFKIKVINRWLKRHGATKNDKATVGLGISMDEIGRMRKSKLPEQDNEYPLIDLRLRRLDCARIIMEAGLPVPPKSACFFCPFHSDYQWWHLRHYRPGLFQKAIELEQFIQAKRVNDLHKDPLTLHHSCRPLCLAVPDQEPLFESDDACDSGFCFT